jgi:DNA-binding NtrC family response regulator
MKPISAALPEFETSLRFRPRIVVVDLPLPSSHRTDLLERIVRVYPGATVIVISEQYSAESALETIQKGACDYFTKRLDIERFRDRVAGLRACYSVRFNACDLCAHSSQ